MSFFLNGIELARIQPEEEYWEWENNQIHLDRYRNPKGRAKVIMLHDVGGNGCALV